MGSTLAFSIRSMELEKAMGEKNKDQKTAPFLYAFVFHTKTCQSLTFARLRFFFYVSSWSVSLRPTYLGDQFCNI